MMKLSVFASLGLLVVAVLAGLLAGNNQPENITRIIYLVRFPRTLAALLAGAAFAVSGAVIQSVLNNPLASPGVIGLNAGAGFGVALFALLNGITHTSIFSNIRTAAFFGAIVTVFFVLMLAQKTGASRTTTILSGIAISSFLTAGTNAITSLRVELLVDIKSFQLGGISGITLSKIFPAGYYIIAAVLILCVFHTELSVLSLGEETAQGLGLRVNIYRFFFLLLAAVLAASAVSFSGLIGFVGLIVPHIARRLLKGNTLSLISGSAVIGGAFLTLCDTLSRVVFLPFEIPVGITVAFIGTPFFLRLLFRRKSFEV
ncbi:MAG: iron ABC transporter permease [Clostridiales bacterium]|jgi:iron complex transport system permease protein|nr:iron ABC transporter permease [Clostridiales bacterium]